MDTIKDYILGQVASKALPATDAYKLLEDLNALENKAQSEQPSDTDIAVIGISCRFPKAANPQQFWEILMNKVDAVVAFPKNRMEDVRLINEKTYEEYKGLNCRVGTYLDRIDLFDHSFFGITPAEARVMDPSQRLFLEVAVEALESAGLTEENLKESKTGVYVGYSISEDNYVDILPKDDPNVALGNQPSLLAYRLSFHYDMRGPTMIIDTACSSSLVAVHQACQAISLGDCDQAIVGGVNVRIYPAIREISNLGIEAFDGRCKTFDEKANGTNIGDGVAALILKRKDLAEKDGDYIHAVIKGSAVNSDGSSNGLTAPNPEAQADVIAKAWDKARINPENLSFIETHGTGTKLGDPIEINGLTHAFRRYTSKKGFCPLSAVKTNIGHLEATSGLAGLIKAILSMENRQLPPNIHYHKPNPYIDFENAPVFPNAQLRDLSPKSDKLLAAVSSFGISGTNCHLVVEEYPRTKDAAADAEQVLVLSAKSMESLKGMLNKYARFLKSSSEVSLRDICYTAAVGRTHYDLRLAVVCHSIQQLTETIDRYVAYLNVDPALRSIEELGVFYADKAKGGSENASKAAYSKYNRTTQSILELYLSGQIINWQNYYRKGKKIPLPTYAFNSKRHWPKLEMERAYDEQDRLKNVFFKLEWVQEASAVLQTPHPILHKENCIYFMHNEPKHHAVVEYATSHGVKAFKVYPGSCYEKHNDNEFTIRPNQTEDYNKLLDDVLQNNSRNISSIVHMWDCLPVGDHMHSFEGICGSQDQSTFSGFKLIRACQQKMQDLDFRFIAMTSYAHKVVSDDKSMDPSRMPFLGLNKVASQEMPKVRGLAIDIDVENFNTETPKDLFAEMFLPEAYKDAVVAYRHGKRYVQVLDREQVEGLKPREFSIRENGVYLIAGGAGYLGLETALYLARQKPVKIALLGRKDFSSFGEKQRRLIKELTDLGSTLHYISCDVTNLQESSKAIESIHQKLGKVNGIFVAIKNISHKRLDDVSFEEFSSNILAKLKGVWLLDNLTKQDPVDFMATFSSISSMTGGPTGADCCASNLFLDSYGDYRNAQGRTTITMNYTLIEADDGSLLSDRMSMIPPLTKAEFLQCLNICLTKKVDFAVMADFDSNVMNLVLPFMKVRFSERLLKGFSSRSKGKGETPAAYQTAVKKSSTQNSDDMTLDDINKIVIQIWKDVLGYDQIDAQANFFNIGGDSISAVKLIHLIKVQLQVDVEVSDLYSYPILSDFAQYLAKKLNVSSKDDALTKLLADIESGKLDPEFAATLI